MISLLDWLESQKTSEGAYLGICNTFWEFNPVKFPHTTNQAGMINGFVNLYKHSKDKKWLKKAEEAADYLISKIDENFFYTIAYGDSPSGPWPDSGPVLQAIPDLSLLRLYFINNKEKYKKVAEENINFTLKKWFNNGHYHVNNQTAKVSEVLLLLNRKREAVEAGEFLVTQHTQLGGLRQSIRDERVFSYYNAKCVPGLIYLYKHTGDERFLNSALKVGHFLEKMQDRKTGLFYNDYEAPLRWTKFMKWSNLWVLRKKPMWVARSFNILYAMRLLSEFDSFNIDFDKLLAYQKKDGSFPNTVGFGKERDGLSTTRWNVYAFEYLTKYYPERFL